MDNRLNPNPGPFNASDLPIDDQGYIYHLQISPEELAPDILLVGDPGRAEMIGSTFFHDIALEHEHRGLVTVTGLSQVSGKPATIISPLKTTVTTSGMGTPSLEIVAQELVILNEIDFETRTRKKDYPQLHVIRVGTSGALQSTTKLGTSIIASYAVGMDNTGFFYEVPYADDHCQRMEKELHQLLADSMPESSRFHGKLHPYVAQAEPRLVKALVESAESLGVTHKLGLTVSNSGFFSPQGRDVARIKPSIEELDRILGEYDPGLDGQRIENMEMETSFLTYFMNALGHWAGAICTTIANRRDNTFDHDYQNAVKNAISTALLALAMVRKDA